MLQDLERFWNTPDGNHSLYAPFSLQESWPLRA
jgi:hypothetical protein